MQNAACQTTAIDTLILTRNVRRYGSLESSWTSRPSEKTAEICWPQAKAQWTCPARRTSAAKARHNRERPARRWPSGRSPMPWKWSNGNRQLRHFGTGTYGTIERKNGLECGSKLPWPMPVYSSRPVRKFWIWNWTRTARPAGKITSKAWSHPSLWYNHFVCVPERSILPAAPAGNNFYNRRNIYRCFPVYHLWKIFRLNVFLLILLNCSK